MTPTEGPSAADILAKASEREIERILREYGEERFARRISKMIVENRRRSPIRTTTELAGLVARAVPRKAWPRRIHVATRTFQALRIAVNDELGRLDRFLSRVGRSLKPGGRVAIISYHSLEDRRVKQAFVEGERLGILKRLTKKPVVATDDETRENPRARSAKLRVAERTEALL
jgi:16S rRNA (cytosine1402-N4)-methyltransferase